jgi:hypothetical protein
VQGSSRVDRELLDAAALVGHLVPAGSVFAFLAEHRRRVFPDELFADLFKSATVRPSIAVDVIASVLVLQTLHDLSDRETADAVRCDLRWKAACGLALTDEGFAQALALLALVAGQDVEPAADDDGTDGRWKIARKVAEDRVISTVDPETRHVHKTVHHRQDGYKAHVVIEPGSGLFTGVKLTKASGDDNHEAVVGLKLLEEEDRVGDEGGLEVLGDTAYASGQARAALEQAGHTVIIKPAPLRPAVLRVAGLNLRRLLNLGLTHSDGTRVLA